MNLIAIAGATSAWRFGNAQQGWRRIRSSTIAGKPFVLSTSATTGRRMIRYGDHVMAGHRKVGDRKSVVTGKRVSVRVYIGGRVVIKKIILQSTNWYESQS